MSCSKIIGSDYKCTSHPLGIADRRRDLNIRLNENNYSAQAWPMNEILESRGNTRGVINNTASRLNTKEI